MASWPTLAAETLLISIAIPFCSFMLYVLLEMAFEAIKLWLLRRRFPGVAFYSSTYHVTPAAAQQRLADLSVITVENYECPAACFPSSAALGGAGVNEMESCAVCLADYEVGEEVKVLPACHHMFHRYCIDSWLFVSRVFSCPVCRRIVFDKMPGTTEQSTET